MLSLSDRTDRREGYSSSISPTCPSSATLAVSSRFPGGRPEEKHVNACRRFGKRRINNERLTPRQTERPAFTSPRARRADGRAGWRNLVGVALGNRAMRCDGKHARIRADHFVPWESRQADGGGSPRSALRFSVSGKPWWCPFNHARTVRTDGFYLRGMDCSQTTSFCILSTNGIESAYSDR